jgi:hypothetical protein
LSRYYKIDITTQAGGPIVPSSLKGGALSSILPNGAFNPGALNIQLDIPVGPFHSPNGDAFLKIEGVGLRDIGNAFDLNGLNIAIYGGMSKGLPLANPAQQGLLLKGAIFNAWGNWIGTEQSVDMTFRTSTGTLANPFNCVLNWPMGTTLTTALAATFTAAFPAATQDIRISPRLTQGYDQPHVARTLNELASWLNPYTRKLIKDTGYPGVNILYDGQTIKAVDQTIPPPVKAIAFSDLIGQPTWIGPLEIQMKTVLRGDLFLQDRVSLPQGLTQITAAALTNFQNKTTFTGNYIIQAIHHFGNYRQPSGDSWATVFDMTPEIKLLP